MFLKDLLNKIFNFMSRRPERQSMQEAGDSNVQIGNVQGNVINQAQQPEINIHIHGVAITAEIATSQESNREPLTSSKPTIHRKPIDSSKPAIKTGRVIDPPEVIRMRKETFTWLERFDGLEITRLFVYSFMVDAFGTKEVMSLNKAQLYRLNRWCTVVYEDKKSKGEASIERSYSPIRQIRRVKIHP
ncbi:MAG: hypothetical protein RSE32_08030 [Comamonas sp.]|uniref:hypothetical protein n=1 Tax=Comamonas sp. TaxID=34028 RepID=UPI002FC9EB34